MGVVRFLTAAGAVAIACAATPASAQFFITSHDFKGDVVKGDEPGIVVMPLTGATEAERRAALVWNLRSALNVAALTCQFEPGLLAVRNYNVMLANHKDELTKSFATLGKYFVRTASTAKAGQTALDQFGTRTYSSFTPVEAQFGFCSAAGSVGAAAAFAARGDLYTVAEARMRELRNAMVPYGEQRFARRIETVMPPQLPQLAERCWKKNGSWTGKCGVSPWDGAAIASNG